MKVNSKGFTLIELLVVIAIIGILSSVVLASMNSARTRGSKAAAIATGRALLPEILTCADDAGYVSAVTAGVSVSANPVCVTAANGTTAVAGHSGTTWSQLPSGWSYAAISSVLASSLASFTLNGPNSTTVTCTIATSVCN